MLLVTKWFTFSLITVHALNIGEMCIDHYLSYIIFCFKKSQSGHFEVYLYKVMYE